MQKESKMNLIKYISIFVFVLFGLNVNAQKVNQIKPAVNSAGTVVEGAFIVTDANGVPRYATCAGDCVGDDYVLVYSEIKTGAILEMKTLGDMCRDEGNFAVSTAFPSDGVITYTITHTTSNGEPQTIVVTDNDTNITNVSNEYTTTTVDGVLNVTNTITDSEGGTVIGGFQIPFPETVVDTVDVANGYELVIDGVPYCIPDKQETGNITINDVVTSSNPDNSTTTNNQYEIVVDGVATRLCEGYENVYVEKICPDGNYFNDRMVRGVKQVGKDLTIESAPEHYTKCIAVTTGVQNINASLDVQAGTILDPNLEVTVTLNNPSTCRWMRIAEDHTFTFLGVMTDQSGIDIIPLISNNGGAFNQVNGENRGWDGLTQVSFTETVPVITCRLIGNGGTQVTTSKLQVRVNRDGLGSDSWNLGQIFIRLFGSTDNN